MVTAAEPAAALKTPGSAVEATAYLISKSFSLESRWKTRKRPSVGGPRLLTIESRLLNLLTMVATEATTPRRSIVQESSGVRQLLTKRRKNQPTRSQMIQSKLTRSKRQTSLRLRRRQTKKTITLRESSHQRQRGSSTTDSHLNFSHMKAESA